MRNVKRTVCAIALGIASLVVIGTSEAGAGGWYGDDCGYATPRVYGSYMPLRSYSGYVGPRVYGSYRPLRAYYSDAYFRPGYAGVYRSRAWVRGYGRRVGWRRW
jgi:hypothetical protein